MYRLLWLKVLLHYYRKNKYIPVLAYLIIQVGSIFSDVVVFVILTVSGALMAGGNQEQAVEGTALIGAAVFVAIVICKSVNLA